MTDKTDPAFPTQGNSASGELEGGLTKREYFAAAAMQGLCAISNYNSQDLNDSWHVGLAKDAVIMADALIAELNKPIAVIEQK